MLASQVLAAIGLTSGNVCVPDQARVVVYLGYMEEPKVVELTVGPLPIPSNYTVLREVPWNTRPPNSAEYSACVPFHSKVLLPSGLIVCHLAHCGCRIWHLISLYQAI